MPRKGGRLAKSQAEKAELEALAKRRGMTVSQLVRWTLHGELVRAMHETPTWARPVVE